MSVLRLGDEVTVNLSYPFSTEFPVECRVSGFRTRPDRVHVIALEVSDDPLVENDWWVSYGAISRAARESPPSAVRAGPVGRSPGAVADRSDGA